MITQSSDKFCQICRKKIENNEIAVPRVDEFEDKFIEGFAHRWCENDTNPYMKYDEDGEPHLTFKGQVMSCIKMWLIIFVMINEKLHVEVSLMMRT